MKIADLSWLLADAPTVPDTGSEKVAFYGMISALGVAFLYGVFNLLSSRYKQGVPAAATRKVLKEHEAFERFLMIHHFDPRKIKTGYESMEEVRRVDSPG